MTDLLEEAATASDALTALVGVTDEGHKGEREELRRIADGLGGMAELVPLLAAASSAATAPLVEKLQGFKGADGKDGADGEPGRDGTDGAPGPVGSAGANGADGTDGTDGADGRNGSDGRNGTDGSPGAKGDKGLNWRGPFDGRISYQPDDAIEFQGSSFVAVSPIRGVTPPGNGWDLLARRGTQGPSGSGGGGGGVALSNAVPLVESGSGAAGTGTKASKDDHVHPADPGGGGGTDDQTAAEVPFTPAGTIAATDTQSAVEEVATEAASALSTHAGAADPHPGYTTAAELTTAISGKADTASAVMDGDAAGGDLSGAYPNPGVVDDSHSHTGATVAGFLPLAAPSGTIDTTTYDDSVSGVGKYRTLVLPIQDAALAIAIAGDTFPRIVMTGDPTEGTYLGDGTQNPVNNGAASWIEGPDVNGFFSYVFEGGGAHQVRFADIEANVGYRTRTQTGITLSNALGGAEATVSVVAGAPVIGGNVGDICIRSNPSGTNDLIYRCTVAGIAGVATWVAQALGLSGSAQTYTESNVTTDRAFNANSTTLDEIADVLGTLIADLRNRGVVA